MKKAVFLIALAAVLLFLFACKTTGGSGGGVEIGVNFAFQNKHGCSNISPEIALSGVPEGTTQLKVRLKDLNVLNWNHGGGTIDYDGSGVIPEGALKSGYNGPCPPSGSHIYQFTVTAIDANGNILGTGKAKQRYP